EHQVQTAPGELSGEGGTQALRRSGDEGPWPVPLVERPGPAGHAAAGHAGAGTSLRGTGSRRWNGWSRRIRQITANGMSSHGAFTARTNGRFAAGVTPYTSSMRMIRTFASMVPDQ